MGRKKRKEELLKFGVTAEFLDAIDHLEDFGRLQHSIQDPDAAYAYLPTIVGRYGILKDCRIIPVCDCNEEDYYVLLKFKAGHQFVNIDLETDEIYRDFGTSFQRLLAHILLHYKDVFSDKVTDEEVIALADHFGLKNSAEIVEAFSKMADGLSMEDWEDQNLPGLLGEPPQ